MGECKNRLRKSMFEKIGIFIPGYIGYSRREDRRNTDKLFRECFVKRLLQQKKLINEKILELHAA